jgi:tripartite-type tricarboxylate transporter receptor subunit TctC
VVQALNQAALRALQSPEVKERLAKLGAEPMPMSPTEFDQYIKDELTANAKIVKAANIKAQ